MSGWSTTGGVSGDGAAPRDESVLSVTQAVKTADAALGALPPLAVVGEVSGFRGPHGPRGHCYFQIKDESSSMECIIWGGVYGASPYELRNGLKMRFTGSFEVYARTGKMSFVCTSFQPLGEGLLRQQVAALAEKLRREGLMDASRKRPIPVFCTRVAVVTSLSGAVIDDVKRTLRRRNALVEVICVNSKVQGAGAEAELIDALGRASRITPAPDCILLVRGGGSFEELMTFNDEALARAVAACPVPVVTGIGHEPDTSICDMVSDRRCSTPTAAAESVAPAMSALADVLVQRENRLAQAMAQGVALRRRALDALAQRPCLQRPDAMLARQAHELDQTQERLDRACAFALGGHRARLDQLAARLPEPTATIAARRRDAGHLAQRLRQALDRRLEQHGSEVSRLAASLEALSPLKVLARGYAIAYGPDGSVARARSLAPGEDVRIRFDDGLVTARVTDVDKQ